MVVSALIDAGRPAEAMMECETMLKSEPARTAPLYFIGRIHEMTGKTDSARRAFERYLSVDSTGSWANDARQHLAMLHH
jgi:hypothetical protein